MVHLVTNMSSLRQFRSKLLLITAAIAVSATTCVLGYRAQSAVPARVQQLAAQEGLLIEPGGVSNTPFSTVMRDIKLRIQGASFVTGVIDELSVRGALFGAKGAHAKQCRLMFVGEPSTIFDGLLAPRVWNQSSLSVGEVNAEYSHPVFGKLSLVGVRVERADDTLVVRATEARLGAARWQDVFFSVHRRNQMIEVGVSDPSPKTAQIQIGYFPSARGGGSQWTLTFTHQPVRPMAQRLGWELGSAFESTSAAGSLSFVIPADKTQKTRGLLQMIVDRWPRPSWPESEALLGGAGSFLARIVPSEDMLRWELVHTEVSTSIFTLVGTGRIMLGARPSIAFDVQGTRTCAQIQGNVPPSVYLDSVNQFLEPSSAADAPARRAAQAGLRLQLFAENAPNGRQQAAWRLEPGCGLSEMTEGTFTKLDLPPAEDATKK